MKIQLVKKLLFTMMVMALATLITISPENRSYVTDVYGQEITVKKKGNKGSKERNFSLSFKDVDISEFATAMSELIGRNIVLDDKVKGKITVTSAKDIPVNQAYNIMKSILELKGFAVVESPHLIKIIPIADAMHRNVDVIIDGKEVIVPDKDNTITYLFKVMNSDATEIANSLKELKSQNTQIITHRSLNTLIFSGMAVDVNNLIKVAKALDEGPMGKDGDKVLPKGNINVVHLENANAEELANVLSRIPFSDTTIINTAPLQQQSIMPLSDKGKALTKTQTQQADKQKLSIVPNKETNSLIITAKPDEFVEIQRVIRELDIVRDQVLIEALIVEVNAESGWGFGIDWMLGQQVGKHMFGGSSIQGKAPSYAAPSGLSGKTLVVPLATQTFQLGYLADTSILGFVLLNATMSDKDTKILSTPQILTVDNHEAELNVAEEIAVPTNTRITDTGNTFQTFDYKSVGIKLKITPHITKKKRITLDLYQEANTINGETTVTSGGSVVPPTLGKRDIKTKVTVNDGKTIVVGGLIRNNKTETVYKTPLLGDIPLLGWFFKRKTVSYVKSNLLVFITPHIVTRQDKMDAVTKQKMNIQRVIRAKE